MFEAASTRPVVALFRASVRACHSTCFSMSMPMPAAATVQPIATGLKPTPTASSASANVPAPPRASLNASVALPTPLATPERTGTAFCHAAMPAAPETISGARLLNPP